ncbi:MAG: serine hydrolase, partial [Draconibacterium sp.]|nr:serine hydrolase [Draconibacterium sp.]
NQFTTVWGDDADNFYGLAFQVITERGSAKGAEGYAGRFGWGGYFNTQYFADPTDKILGVIMKQTQGNTGDQTGWKFQQLVFQTIDD